MIRFPSDHREKYGIVQGILLGAVFCQENLYASGKNRAESLTHLKKSAILILIYSKSGKFMIIT